jgi:hypothetical protein
VGLHVTITGFERPSSAPATSMVRHPIKAQLDQVGADGSIASLPQFRHP